MAVRRLSGGGVGIDTRGFRAFVAATRKAAPLVSRGLRQSQREAGEIVARAARSDVAKHSTSVPPTIKVRTRTATVAVRAGDADTPLALLYEQGNKGRNPNAPTFRSPIFAAKDSAAYKDPNRWKDQPRYPFLRPAAAKTMPEVEAVMLKNLDAAIDMLAGG